MSSSEPRLLVYPVPPQTMHRLHFLPPRGAFQMSLWSTFSSQAWGKLSLLGSSRGLHPCHLKSLTFRPRCFLFLGFVSPSSLTSSFSAPHACCMLWHFSFWGWFPLPLSPLLSLLPSPAACCGISVCTLRSFSSPLASWCTLVNRSVDGLSAPLCI